MTTLYSRGQSFEGLICLLPPVMWITLALFLCLPASHILHVTGKPNFGNYVNVCSVKDPKLNECVLKAANKIMPMVVKGIKEFGLPPLDPLLVPRMDVGQDTGPVTIKFVLTNSTQTGITGLTWHAASVDPKRGRWVLNGTMPSFSVKGKYRTQGKILILPIVGEGECTFTLFNLSMSITIDGKPVKTKDEVVFKFKSFRVNMYKLEKTVSHLTNLFKGNKALGDQMNQFLNDNDKEIAGYMKGSLNDVYSALFGGLLQKMMDIIPYNQLFTDL